MPNVKKNINKSKIRRGVGPAELLSELELPPADTIRWSPRRKAEVVLAVTGGVLTAEEACRRYRMSPEELSEWISGYQLDGMKGLHRKMRNYPRHPRTPSGR